MNALCKYTIAILSLAALASCSGFGDDTKFFVYQEKKDGMYGMVSESGATLFEPEFKESITSMNNDRFFAKNGNGKWEIYSIKDGKPTQVGDNEFVSIADYTKNVTVAVKEDGFCEIIDKDGDTKKVLDKINNKYVKSVSAFFENGYAIFRDQDNNYGIIDTSGDVLCPADYTKLEPLNQKYFLAVDKKYKDSDNYQCDVISANGDIAFSFKSANYSIEIANDKYFVIKKEGKYGIINRKGETVVEASDKNGKIVQLLNNGFVFCEDGAYGFKTYDSEIIIRASKYEVLYGIDEDGKVFIAATSDDYRGYLVDADGEKIGSETFTDFRISSDEYIPVETGKNSWEFMKVSDGTLVRNTPDIYEIKKERGNVIIYCDHVVISAEIAALNISENSMDGYKFSDSNEKIAGYAYSRNDESYGTTASDWYLKDKIAFYKTGITAMFNMELHWNGFIARSDEDFNSQFSNDRPYFLIKAEGVGKLEGKLNEVYKEFEKIIKTWGNVVASTDNTIMVKTKSGYYAVCKLHSSDVTLKWGPTVNPSTEGITTSDTDENVSDTIKVDSVTAN